MSPLSLKRQPPPCFSSFHLFAFCFLLFVCVSRAVFHSVLLFLCLPVSRLSAFLSFFLARPALLSKRGGWGWGCPSVLLFCLGLQQPLLSLSCGVTGRTTTRSPIYLWKDCHSLCCQKTETSLCTKRKKYFQSILEGKNRKCMQLVVFVTVGVCAVIDFFIYHMVCALIYIWGNLDVVFSLYSLLLISFLAAISSCQNASPSSAHYCHTHAYLGSNSWVMSVRMCSVVTLCYLCKSLHRPVISHYAMSEKPASYVM